MSRPAVNARNTPWVILLASPVEAPSRRYFKYLMGNFSICNAICNSDKVPPSRRPPVDPNEFPWSIPSFPRRGALPSIPENSLGHFRRRSARLSTVPKNSIGAIALFPPTRRPPVDTTQLPWSFPSFHRRGARLSTMPEKPLGRFPRRGARLSTMPENSSQCTRTPPPRRGARPSSPSRRPPVSSELMQGSTTESRAIALTAAREKGMATTSLTASRATTQARNCLYKRINMAHAR
jgi:hypothetical protein